VVIKKISNKIIILLYIYWYRWIDRVNLKKEKKEIKIAVGSLSGVKVEEQVKKRIGRRKRRIWFPNKELSHSLIHSAASMSFDF
jgi:hypothetical protein